MIYPNKINAGDTVGLLCPSSAIKEDERDKCIEVLEKMGFKVVVGRNLTTNYAGYMAGSGQVRGAEINRMFADKEIKAIFCACGGDAGSRAVPFVDKDVVRQNPKIFVGYSDVTSFNLLFNQECGLITFHGPMVLDNMVRGMDEFTEKSFKSALYGDKVYELKNPPDTPIKVLKEGKAVGRVVGGNLSLLSAAMGTPYEMQTAGKIVFIEDTNETLNRIERFAYQLRNGGKFAECAGIILGQFTNCPNNDDPSFDVIDCFKDIFDNIDKPVMYDIQTGHGESNITIPLGAMCHMDTSEKSIVFDIERD